MDTTWIPLLSAIIAFLSLSVAVINMRHASRKEHDETIKSQAVVAERLDSIDTRLTRVENKIDVATPLPKGTGGKE